MFQNKDYRSHGNNLETPAIDLLANKNGNYQLLVDLAGIEKSDLKLKFENDLLEILAQKKGLPKNFKALHIENYTMGYSRKIRLPQNVDAEKIQATLEEGLLILDLPLFEKSQAKKIQIQ